MAKDFSRSKRVGDQIQRELALLIQQEIKDPRIGMVTVTAVQVGREFDIAKVYVMTSGDEQAKELSLNILNRAAGFLRHELGHRLTIRNTPQLRFLQDISSERGAYLSQLIDKAVATDKKNKT